MASDAPDPQTLQSWEDAFQYPIPVVRKLEQQLRTNADENREKLRSLVGASYRNLLDTAETIINMEVSMEQVESKLSSIGQSCNSRSLERVASNAIKMETHTKSRDAELYTLTSQLSVLRNAPLVMTRLMKKGASYLLIAKVLVISRLLHKALSQSKNKPTNVDQIWERLLSVRRKLLRRIDKRLSNTVGDNATLVESMCAYALATSSTPTDVLQHFHKVRLDKIKSELKTEGSELARHGISALRLCIQTCLDTQAIFPRRLAEALAKLKAHSLVQDPDVRGLYELNLDIYDRWIGDEARNYTPWPRHDELQRLEAEKILNRWSKDAITAFLKGIKNALAGEKRLKEVASLRQELIETWILSGSRIAGVKSTNVLDDLRDTMNEKLGTIVRSRTEALQIVVTELVKQLDSLPSSRDTGNLSLWNTASQASDLSNGAQVYKTTIIDTYQGRDQAVSTVSSAFDNWMESVLEVKGIIKSMKEARWDDTFADDVGEESDDDLGDSKQVLLSDDDPKLLEEATQEALSKTMQTLGKSFLTAVQRLTKDKEGALVQRVIFILRVIREVNDRIPRLRVQDKSAPLSSPFTAEILQPLHSGLVMHVVEPILHGYAASLVASIKVTTESYILWEGNPPLPSQPSPSAFRFLWELSKNMGSLGSDLWAPGCVSALKKQVTKELVKVFEATTNNIGALNHGSLESIKTPNGETSDANNGEMNEIVNTDSSTNVQELQNQKLKQLLFDALYIQRFMAVDAEDKNRFTALINAPDVAHLDEAALSRLRKNAADYARKTYLLFALLV